MWALSSKMIQYFKARTAKQLTKPRVPLSAGSYSNRESFKLCRRFGGEGSWLKWCEMVKMLRMPHNVFLMKES